VKVACAQLDATAPTSDLRAKFLRFLGQPAVMGLLRELTVIAADATWTALESLRLFSSWCSGGHGR
jgi:hypothetical protein